MSLRDEFHPADPAGPASNSNPPSISILAPVLNEERHLGSVLEALSRQRYPRDSYEILVIDGGSVDSTVEIAAARAASDRRIRVLENPGRWSSRGRNIGVRASTGDYILVIDGHCQIRDSHYLSKVAQLFEETGADCLGRPQPLEAERAGPLQQAIAIARSSPIGHHADSLIYSTGERFSPAISVAVAYRRSVFAKIGLFDETFDACEDVDFNYRVDQSGLSCFFSDRIALPYVPRESLPGLARQLFRYGRGRVRLLRKHPSTFSLKSLAPGLLVAAVSIGAVLAGIFGRLEEIVTAGVALYVGAILLTSACLARKSRRLRVALLIPVCLVTIHASTGVGTLVEFLSWIGAWVRPRSPTSSSEPRVRARTTDSDSSD